MNAKDKVIAAVAGAASVVALSVPCEAAVSPESGVSTPLAAGVSPAAKEQILGQAKSWQEARRVSFRERSFSKIRRRGGIMGDAQVAQIDVHGVFTQLRDPSA